MFDRQMTLSVGMDISYLDVGAPDGDVVLYFHGTPSSRMQATGPLDAVAAGLGLRIIAPDRPGYGAAPRSCATESPTTRPSSSDSRTR